MLRLVIATSALALLAGTADAQTATWSGPYVGVAAEYNLGETAVSVELGESWAVNPPALRDDVTEDWSLDQDMSGGGVGLVAGYRRQFSNNFFVGGELGYSYLNLETSFQSGPNPTVSVPILSYDFNNTAELKNSATARLHLGYGSDRVMGYAIFGYTSVDARAYTSILSNGAYSKEGETSNRIDGTTLGLGAAWRLNDRLSISGEYTHTELGDLEFTTVYRPGSTFTSPSYREDFTQEFSLESFRVGLNYHF